MTPPVDASRPGVLAPALLAGVGLMAGVLLLASPLLITAFAAGTVGVGETILALVLATIALGWGAMMARQAMWRARDASSEPAAARPAGATA